MSSAVSNITFPGLKRSHPLELTTFRALKDNEAIDNEEKFGKAFISLRDIVENLGLQKECVEIIHSKSSVKIVFKKAELKKVIDRKIEAKVFEIDINSDKKENKVTIKHSSGMYSTPTNALIKSEEEKKGDFTFKEIRDSFVEFYNKNKETILQWEADLLQAEYDSINQGELPANVVVGILQNLSPDGNLGILGSVAYVRANAALAKISKVVDKTKIDPAKPLEGDNILETIHLELGLKDRTPEEWFKLVLEKKEKEALKLQEKPSDKPVDSHAKKKEEIKIPDVIPILYRDLESASKEFFLPSIASTYQKDLDMFFKKLDLGMSATFHKKRVDNHASITIFESSYIGPIDERPQVTLRIAQDQISDGHLGTRIKYTSKKLVKIKELLTVDGANGTSKNGHGTDVNGVHVIEERPISGALEVSQVDHFVFKLALIFANAIRAEKKDKDASVKSPVELASTNRVEQDYSPEDYIPAS